MVQYIIYSYENNFDAPLPPSGRTSVVLHTRPNVHIKMHRLTIDIRFKSQGQI